MVSYTMQLWNDFGPFVNNDLALHKWVAMQILMRINEETWDCKLEFAYHMHVSRLGRQDLHLLELVGMLFLVTPFVFLIWNLK